MGKASENRDGNLQLVGFFSTNVYRMVRPRVESQQLHPEILLETLDSFSHPCLDLFVPEIKETEPAS